MELVNCKKKVAELGEQLRAKEQQEQEALKSTAKTYEQLLSLSAALAGGQASAVNKITEINSKTGFTTVDYGLLMLQD